MADTTSTSIKIQLQTNGDSIWTTEKQIPLETPGDVAGWDATAANGTDSYKAEFESQMKSYVARISTECRQAYGSTGRQRDRGEVTAVHDVG